MKKKCTKRSRSAGQYLKPPIYERNIREVKRGFIVTIEKKTNIDYIFAI